MSDLMRMVPVLALALGGCILGADEPEPTCGDGTVDEGEACDDGNNVADDGCSGCVVDIVPRNLSVTWTLRTAASSAPVTCPQGYDTAEIVTQNVAADGTPMGAPQIDVLDCSAGAATLVFDSSRVAEVAVSVRITTGTGGTVFAESLSETVDLSVADGELAVAILTDGGYFGLAWTLRGQTSGNELTCATVEPDQIEVVSVGAASMYTDRFTCADGDGRTGALPAGSYGVTVEAIANDEPLGPAVLLSGKVVLDKNRITDLGVVEIPISGL
ncbi:MAG: hypothetical protein SFX73_11055 [Kofleriaceae bacterium]|nr:hypothetical protein [Kofleriaceae bacterium]